MTREELLQLAVRQAAIHDESTPEHLIATALIERLEEAEPVEVIVNDDWLTTRSCGGCYRTLSGRSPFCPDCGSRLRWV